MTLTTKKQMKRSSIKKPSYPPPRRMDNQKTKDKEPNRLERKIYESVAQKKKKKSPSRSAE